MECAFCLIPFSIADKVKLPLVGVFRRTGRASADVATGRGVLSRLSSPTDG